MRIDSIGNQTSAARLQGSVKVSAPDENFAATITKSLEEVNRLQSEADHLVNRLASGDSVELHQAMIAMQKASTALQFTIQVRNKVVEAYQEIMRMQV